MGEQLKKLVFVDPSDPTKKYEVFVKGADKANRALMDANGDVIHNVIEQGELADRYNYVLIGGSNFAKAGLTTSKLAQFKSMRASTFSKLTMDETENTASYLKVKDSSSKSSKIASADAKEDDALCPTLNYETENTNKPTLI